MVFIISGEQGSGKTTMLKSIIGELQSKGVKVGGFIAEGSWMNSIRDGFSLLRIIDTYSIPLCQSEPKKGYFNLGRFWFNTDAIKIGEESLGIAMTKDMDMVVIDEIGIFELQRKIWYNSFIQLLNESKLLLVIAVRSKILKEVIKVFKLSDYCLCSTEDEVKSIVNVIKQKLYNN